MDHFKLTSETKVNSHGKTLYRIESTKKTEEFGIGIKGGWVESSANIAGNGWVMEEGEVFENAIVYGKAVVSDNSKVYGDAEIFGFAHISGNAEVYGNAQVFDRTKVFQSAKVYGQAIIKDRSRIQGEVEIFGDANISGRSRMDGGQWDKSPYQFLGSRGAVSYVNTSDPSTLRIGCVSVSFDEWYQNKEAIAAEHGLTLEELAEYTVYLNEAYQYLYPDSSI